MHRATVTPPIPIDIEAVTNKFETSTLTATDLLVAGISIAAGFVLGAITRKAVARLIATVPGVRPTTGSILARLAGYIVVVFGFVIAFSALGLSFGPVITLLLMIALVAVLIGRPMLADLGAGVVLQSRQPVQIGDVVQICDGPKAWSPRSTVASCTCAPSTAGWCARATASSWMNQSCPRLSPTASGSSS